MQFEKDKTAYQGSQIPLIGFDELTHFSSSQFFYLLSRNRSAGAGFAPYVRATCNPDPDHWLRSFIDWWIGRDGFAIPERSGMIRYFLRGDDDEFLWAESRDALIEEHAYARQQLDEMKETLRRAGVDGDVDPKRLLIKSFTFIPSTVEDNPALLRKDPTYLANLQAQDKVTRMQLLGGNWDVRPAAGLYFQRQWLPLFSSGDDALPDVPTIKRVCRYWDMAATEPHQGNPDPDYLVGLLLAELKETHEGTRYIVLDVERHRKSPGTVKSIIQRVARKDADDYGRRLLIRMEQQPGSAGKSQIADYERLLSSYDFRGDKVTGDKITRAEAPSSAAEPTEERPERQIGVRKADWNEAFLQELESFPDGNHDDQVDALSGAYNCLTSERRRPFSSGRY
jgi:predicted phage terminase large subunit-like protein